MSSWAQRVSESCRTQTEEGPLRAWGKPTFEPDSLENLAVNNLYAAGAGAVIGFALGGDIRPSSILSNAISGAVTYDIVVGVKAYQHGGTGFIVDILSNTAKKSPAGYAFCYAEQGLEKSIAWWGSETASRLDRK